MNRKRSIAYILLCIVTGAVFVSCENSEPNNLQKRNDKLHILSSFSIITDMVKEIGKDKVEVHNLAPVGTAPHDYSPIPNDIKFALTADLWMYNGLNLEGGEGGWFFKMKASTKTEDNKLVEVAKNVSPLYILDNGRKEVNPHAFINPIVGISMAKTIRDALSVADTINAEFYQKNASSYIQKLTEIELQYRTKLSEIPKENRVFVTSEQAFQYLTREYNLKEGFIWAIDTEKNGTPDQIKATIAFIENNRPKTLFVESNVDARPMETVSKATGVPIFENPIFSDELGKPGHVADSYVKYLEYNLTQIYNGLK